MVDIPRRLRLHYLLLRVAPNILKLVVVAGNINIKAYSEPGWAKRQGAKCKRRPLAVGQVQNPHLSMSVSLHFVPKLPLLLHPSPGPGT